jgi:predicted nuclease of predicted toxin-antitoxin system
MPKYLIDVNLPYYFSIWNNEQYIHQSDLDLTAKDSHIWLYAQERNMTIVTKDADFSNRMLLNQPKGPILIF